MAGHDAENLRLAYDQQVENIRESKRLQWQMAYFAFLALAALAGVPHIHNPSCGGAWLLTVVGGFVAAFASVVIVRSMGVRHEHRQATVDIAKELSENEKLRRPDSSLAHLLGVDDADYPRRTDPEVLVLIVALPLGAVIVGWLLVQNILGVVVWVVVPLDGAALLGWGGRTK